MFSVEFNQDIHNELKRMRRTLWASLDLWYLDKRPDHLKDLIFYHILAAEAT